MQDRDRYFQTRALLKASAQDTEVIYYSGLRNKTIDDLLET